MAATSGITTGAVAAAGAAVVLAVVGYLNWGGPAPVVMPEPVASATVAAEPAPAVVPVPAIDQVAVAQPEATAPVVAAPAVILPGFDVVRVEPDGSATVAGSAAPGAVVLMLLDGAETARATADKQGKFAALFTLAPSAAPRRLALAAIGPDGTQILGTATVAIAAIAPAVVAEAPAAAASVAEPTSDAPVVAMAADPAPAALLISPEGVKVLQPGSDVAPEVATNVSVDTISYAPDGAVLLGGRGQAAGFVRLYLDDAEAATVTVPADGQWSAKLVDVAPGLYTLRADQIGGDGKVISRFETPFKRETLTALAAAIEPKVDEPAKEQPAGADQAAAEPAVAEPAAEVAATGNGDAVATAAPKADAVVKTAVPDPAVPDPSVPDPAAPSAVVSVVKGAQPPSGPITVTVQPGFTLWGIAEQNFGTGVLYVQLFDANKDKIRDPDLIYPGQVFTIPAAN